MIDEGSNIVSTSTLQNLNIYLTYLSAPTLAIRAFNNTLSTTLVVLMTPLKVKVVSIPTACHIMEGDITYNIILIRPWINKMEGISSSKHGCFKYLYEGKIHCIPMDANPFSHCTLIQVLDPFSMPSLLSIIILMNENPNQASSYL